MKNGRGGIFFSENAVGIDKVFLPNYNGNSFRKLIADRTMPDLQGSESLNVMFRIFTSFFVFRYRNEASEKSGKMTKGGQS